MKGFANAMTLVLLVIAACTPKAEGPKVNKEKFTKILADLALEEAKYVKTYDLDSNAQKILAWHSDSILKQYKVSKEDFKQSIEYYQTHKEEMVKVYKIALDTILARRDTLLNRKD